MAAGYPVKVDYVTGDVLTATNLNDLAGTVNLYDPTAKGDLFPATSADAVSRLAVGANNTVLTADSAAATGMKWAAAGGGTVFPAFRAYETGGSLTISASTWTKLLFTTEVFDTNNNFASSRFTPTVAGYYQISCTQYMKNTATGNFELKLYKNGSGDVYFGEIDGSNVAVRINGSFLVYLNGSTDYVEAYVRIAGGTTTIFRDADTSAFSGVGVKS